MIFITKFDGEFWRSLILCKEIELFTLFCNFFMGGIKFLVKNVIFIINVDIDFWQAYDFYVKWCADLKKCGRIQAILSYCPFSGKNQNFWFKNRILIRIVIQAFWPGLHCKEMAANSNKFSYWPFFTLLVMKSFFRPGAGREVWILHLLFKLAPLNRFPIFSFTVKLYPNMYHCIMSWFLFCTVTYCVLCHQQKTS